MRAAPYSSMAFTVHHITLHREAEFAQGPHTPVSTEDCEPLEARMQEVQESMTALFWVTEETDDGQSHLKCQQLLM